MNDRNNIPLEKNVKIDSKSVLTYLQTNLKINTEQPISTNFLEESPLSIAATKYKTYCSIKRQGEEYSHWNNNKETLTVLDEEKTTHKLPQEYLKNMLLGDSKLSFSDNVERYLEKIDINQLLKELQENVDQTTKHR